MITNIKNQLLLTLQDMQHVVFLLIGVCSFGYFAGGKSFAELHVSMPFLDFPIFIGEILLGLCLMLILISSKNVKLVNSRRIMVALYLLFVVAKAFYGYSQWGPLAFRHSALFYYPLFLYVGYKAFNRKFFNDCINSFLVGLLILAQRFSTSFRLHTFVAIMLLVVLIAAISNKKLKIILALFALSLFKYNNILFISRTELVGLSAGLIFVIAMFFVTLKIKPLQKIVMLLLCVSMLTVYALNFKQKANVTSLFRFNEIRKVYQQQMKIRDLKALTTEPFEYEPVQIYQDDEKLKLEYAGRVEAEELRLLLEKDFDESRAGMDDNGGVLIDSLEKKGWEVEASLVPYFDTTQKINTEAKLIDADKFITKELQWLKTAKIEGFRIRGENSRLFDDEAVSMENFRKLQEGMTAKELIKKMLNKRVEIISQHKDQMLRNIKIGMLNKLNQLYGIDERVGRGIFENELESREALTNQLYKVYDLNTVTEQVTLAKILRDKLDLSSQIEKNILVREIIALPYVRSVTHAISSGILFRIYIWEDAIKDIIQNKPIIGFDFGKPFRSRNLEITRLAAGEWMRDGWIAIHNSYIDIVYRAGVMGVIYIVSLFIVVISVTKRFYKGSAMPGLLLVGALIYWMTMANFGEILQMPYHAIPFWSLLGMTIAYSHQRKGSVSNVLEK